MQKTPREGGEEAGQDSKKAPLSSTRPEESQAKRRVDLPLGGIGPGGGAIPCVPRKDVGWEGRSKRTREDTSDPFEGPFDLAAFDDQGRSKADHLGFGVFGEDASLHQGEAVIAGQACFRMEFDADQETASTDLLDEGALEGAQGFEKEGTLFGSAAREVFVEDHIESFLGDGTGERIAAEGAAVIAGAKEAEDGLLGDDSRDRVEAAAEGFSEDHDIGFDLVVFVAKELSCATEADLDLVGDQEDTVLVADLADTAQVAFRRDDHTAFALDRLDQEGDRFGGDRAFEGVKIAEGEGSKARKPRPKVFFVLRACGKADDPQGTAMKVIVARQDLALVGGDAFDLVAPFSGDLECGFDAFCAGVHQEDEIEATEFGEFFVERAELVVIEGPRGQGKAAKLGFHRLDDPGVEVALVEGGVGTQHIQVSLAFCVFEPATLALDKNHGEGFVVLGSIEIRLSDQAVGRSLVHTSSERSVIPLPPSLGFASERP